MVRKQAMYVPRVTRFTKSTYHISGSGASVVEGFELSPVMAACGEIAVEGFKLSPVTVDCGPQLLWRGSSHQLVLVDSRVGILSHCVCFCASNSLAFFLWTRSL